MWQCVTWFLWCVDVAHPSQVREGVIPVLLEAVREGGALAAPCAAALRNLANSADAQLVLGRAGAVDSLKRMLKDSPTMDGKAQASTPVLKTTHGLCVSTA